MNRQKTIEHVQLVKTTNLLGQEFQTATFPRIFVNVC